MTNEQELCECGKPATINLHQNHVLSYWDGEGYDEVSDEFDQEDFLFCTECFEKKYPGIWETYTSPGETDET